MADNVLPLKKEFAGILPQELKTNIQTSLNDTDGVLVKKVESEINNYIVGKAVAKASNLGELVASKIAKLLGLV